MTVIALEYVRIGTSQLAAWREFARSALGVDSDAGDQVDIRLRRGCITVQPDERDGALAIGWAVPDEADLDRVANRLAARGGSAERSAPGAQLAFRDPYGFRHELSTSAPQSDRDSATHVELGHVAHHIELESDELADVQQAFERMHRAGRARSEIGQHSNDNTVSFYMETPSGFQIEYGYGSLRIDENAWTVRKLFETSAWGHRKLLPEPNGPAE
jgi:hypothetical protein